MVEWGLGVLHEIMLFCVDNIGRKIGNLFCLCFTLISLKVFASLVVTGICAVMINSIAANIEAGFLQLTFNRQC